jgi:hypothetical protein
MLVVPCHSCHGQFNNIKKQGLTWYNLVFFLNQCATFRHLQHRLKNLDAPADIETITKNMGLILNCIEIKAERFVNNSGAGLKNADWYAKVWS